MMLKNSCPAATPGTISVVLVVTGNGAGFADEQPAKIADNKNAASQPDRGRNRPIKRRGFVTLMMYISLSGRLLFVEVLHNIEPVQRAGKRTHRRQMDIAAAIRAISHAEEKASVVHNARIENESALVAVAGILGPAHQVGIVP